MGLQDKSWSRVDRKSLGAPLSTILGRLINFIPVHYNRWLSSCPLRSTASRHQML